MASRRARAVLFAAGALLLGAALTALLVPWALDEAAIRETPEGTFDAIVVLGCRVDPWGAPSHALERRAEHAARLFHEGRGRHVIVTGGVGDFGPSEAEVAARVLVRAGVPRDVIMLEDASTSTFENAAFARERFGLGSVLVVTDAFHTVRAARVFAQHYDRVAVTGSDSPFARSRRVGLLREVAALGIYAALGRISIGEDAPEGACELPLSGPELTHAGPRFSDDALPPRRARAPEPPSRAPSLALLAPWPAAAAAVSRVAGSAARRARSRRRASRADRRLVRRAPRRPRRRRAQSASRARRREPSTPAATAPSAPSS